MISKQKKAILLLADGTEFAGYSFGAEGTAIGEVVFSTSMVGYQEALTDPCYYGQLLMQTFPSIGNYGINTDQESDRTHVKGYIVREWCEMPSNFRCEGNLDAFMKQNHVIGLFGIDTRSLTRKLREEGTMNGMITTEPLEKQKALEKIRAYRIENAVESVSCQEKKYFPAENAKYEVAVYDFGCRRSTIAELQKRGCNVTLLPCNTPAETVAAMHPDGILFSNGPGNPAENGTIIENIRAVSALQIPMFAIGLGHQLYALAQGGRTEKLHAGHRGASQPVIDCQGTRTYPTSQNHGYTVVPDSIPSQIGSMSYKNVNDGSCEGMRYADGTCTVQFQPEFCGGPMDTSFMFDEFISRFQN